MEKGQGFEYRWKDWPLTGGRKRALEQTQSYLRFDGRKLRVLIWWLFSLWSRRQGHPLRMNGQWGSWTFDISIAGLCYCWGGRWGWWSWIYRNINSSSYMAMSSSACLLKCRWSGWLGWWEWGGEEDSISVLKSLLALSFFPFLSILYTAIEFIFLKD